MLQKQNEKYQGFTNEQTWCVNMVFNNTKKTQDEVLNIVRDSYKYPNLADAAEGVLIIYATRLLKELHEMAPWCWLIGDEQFSSMLGDDMSVHLRKVNWTEIRLELEEKVKEGA